jgi:tetratricopeptide (TPR) repeat protein
MRDAGPSAWLPLLTSRPQQWALGIAGAILTLVGFLPLFAGPGYEAGLAAGLVLPTAAALATSFEVARSRPSPIRAYERGLVSGASLALLGFVITLVHGLRSGFCDPWNGSAHYWLGGGAGACVGGIWGAAAGVIAATRTRRRSGLALLLAFLGPALGVVVSLVRFYTSPMVFGFDPFFGYFAGPLYDTVVGGLERLAWFRLGTTCTLLAAAAVAVHLVWNANDLRWRWNAHWAWRWFGAAAALVSAAMGVSGARLGHWSTSQSIARALGKSTAAQRCTVLHSAAIPSREVALLAHDCDVHVAELERFFECTGPDRITVFLFESSEQKARYMGASRTQIAKPWRREIYIQRAPFPHPVLRHELAHVVAGAFGQGPFAVGGPIRGIIPDPGRIEGVAEAAAPDEDADLSLQQWARAMRDLGHLPPLESVFRLTFLTHNASTAYTVAGAFVAWLHDAHGAAAVRAWYGGATLESATQGRTLRDLEHAWLASLDQVRISESALHAARWRFDRPAIFGRRCPRQVDALNLGAGEALGRGDQDTARDRYDRILALDPGHLGARRGVSTCDVRAGNVEAARTWLQAVAADEQLITLQRARVTEDLGDLALTSGRFGEARRRYETVARVTLREDALRTLDLKIWAATDPVVRPAVVQLLIGSPPFGANWGAAAEYLGRWSELRPEEGTPDYILGRNYFTDGRWELAAEHLDRALERRFELQRVHDEALRIRLLVACALGNTTVAARVFDRWQVENASSSARQAGTRARARRCGVEVD